MLALTVSSAPEAFFATAASGSIRLMVKYAFRKASISIYVTGLGLVAVSERYACNCFSISLVTVAFFRSSSVVLLLLLLIAALIHQYNTPLTSLFKEASCVLPSSGASMYSILANCMAWVLLSVATVSCGKKYKDICSSCCSAAVNINGCHFRLTGVYS
ncbi:hypothetical protein D3C86_1044610 [compost metagenome]